VLWVLAFSALGSCSSRLSCGCRSACDAVRSSGRSRLARRRATP